MAAPQPGADKQPQVGADRQWGMWVVMGGLLVLAFSIGMAVERWTTAADATSVITASGSVIGTMVGAFFGVEAGGQGRKEAQKSADKAHDLASASQSQALEHMKAAARANQQLAQLAQLTSHLPAEKQAQAQKILGM